jgi:4-hydroxy-tetrahydrodipicolinate reductase
MAEPVRIAVFGAAGKMGGAIVRAIAETPGACLVAAVERPDFPELGADARRLAGLPESGVRLQSNRPGRGAADMWVDFSAPGAAVANSIAAAQMGAAIVIGVTGLSAQDKEAIASQAEEIPIVLAPNMSVGVNVMLRLVADAARILGSAYDIEIVEAHHRAKRDAPSGTALRLAEAVAEASGRDLGKSARFERHGEIGPRTADEIGIQTIRGGDVVGDHTVYFLGQGDRIEITHRASSRETLARGAVRAALWLHGRAPGLYDMRDVLGLR